MPPPPAKLISLLQKLYPERTAPPPLNLLQWVASGQQPGDGELSRQQLKRFQEAKKSKNPTKLLIGSLSEEELGKARTRARKKIGELALGRAAERAFERIYEEEGDAKVFTLRDTREDRNTTDFRIFDASDRPVFRLNIKFFGSNFRRGPELVSLEPADCFPLATYKIHLALQKQESEHLPYVFVVVGVPGLTGVSVGEKADDDLVEALALLLGSDQVKGKRDIEDRVVGFMEQEQEPSFVAAYDAIYAAPWQVISARRADNLLRQLLFERVYAVRVRSFAQQFRNAELDMHFSLKGDMCDLREFFKILRDGGVQRASTMLERGDI